MQNRLYTTRITKFCYFALMAIITCSGLGCASLVDPSVPEPIHQAIEPRHGVPYLLYRPAGYDRSQSWPLIVACHGGFGDSPNKQLRRWTKLAESRGFLVVAPTLASGRRFSVNKAEKYVQDLRADEKHILGVINHVRAAHNISLDRIFIAGQAEGVHAALFAGLRHAEIFRAISLAHPKFVEEVMREADDDIDHAQPVYLQYSIDDILWGKKGKICADWLRAHGVTMEEDRTASTKTDGRRYDVEFFENVIRKHPWAVIRQLPVTEGGPLDVQFILRTTLVPRRYEWTFGDGGSALVAEPVHAFAKPGQYLVSVTIDVPGQAPIHRSRQVHVP